MSRTPKSPAPSSAALEELLRAPEDEIEDVLADPANSILMLPEVQEEIRIKVKELENLVPDSSLVGGRTFASLNAYEKKSLLINAELDAMGMGRYQWCIFFLCGFGYFLDLCWAQAFGLVGAAIQQELGVSDARVGDLSTAFNAGLTIGAFAWGLAVDIVGRRWCFNLTCLSSSVFGLLFATPSSYGLICACASMIGFGVGGNIPVDTTVTLEFLPENRRFLVAALSTFQPLGTVAASIIALGLIPDRSCARDLPSCNTGITPCCTRDANVGWRYLVLVLGCITLFIFFLRFGVFKFRESPKFLLARSQDLRALDVLHSICKFNKIDPPTLAIEDMRAIDFEEAQKRTIDETTSLLDAGDAENGGGGSAKEVVKGGWDQTFGHLRGIWEKKVYAWMFGMLAIAYMSLFWSFSIAGFFLPLILRAKGVGGNQSTEDTYRSYVWIYLPGVTATIAAAAVMEAPTLGRKWPMAVAAGFIGISDILYQLANSIPANIGLNAMSYWFQSFYAALLYAFTPEAFPAPVRGSASGILSTLGRIASIVAPIAASSVYHGGDSPGVLYLAGGAAWLSMIAIALLPFDTKGKQSF